MSICPLCHHQHSAFFHQDTKRTYLQCPKCNLVFVSPEYLPSAKQEKHEYDLHENNIEDEGYLLFLNRLAAPLLTRLTPQSEGLDFGCGPTPALASLIQQQSHSIALYDPFYYPTTDVLEKHYDFICCSEAIEHFHAPYKEWLLWQQLLKPTGWLAIMTKRVIDQNRFANWHYKNDPTHVCFFSEATFCWLAQQHNMSVEFIGNDVVLMQKLA